MDPTDLVGPAALVAALALAIPRIVDALQRAAESRRLSASTDAVTAATVREMFASLKRSLESRIDAIEREHRACQDALGDLRNENAALRERLAHLENERDQLADAHNAVVEQLASAEGRIAMLTTLLRAGEDERQRILRDLDAGGGSDFHAPVAGVTIDAVLAQAAKTRRERSQ